MEMWWMLLTSPLISNFLFLISSRFARKFAGVAQASCPTDQRYPCLLQPRIYWLAALSAE
jgi:hypothetical protein